MATGSRSIDWNLFIRIAAEARSEDHLLSELAHLCKHVLDVAEVDIVLVEQDEFVLRASTMAPEFVRRMRVSKLHGLAGKVVTSGVRQIVKKDMGQNPAFQHYNGYDESGCPSAIIEPLVIHKGVIGAIFFRKKEPWEPRNASIQLAESLAATVSGLLATYRTAYEAGAAASHRMGAVSQVTDILSRSPYLEEILQLLVNMTAQQFHYRVCTVRLLDETNNELVLRATQASSKGYQRKRAIRLGESIAGRVIVEQQTMIVEDVQGDPEYIGHDLAVEQGLRSMICVPLLIQERAVGVLTCYTDRVRMFDPDEVDALETIAKQAAVSIEHAKLQVRNTLMQEMHHRVKNNLQQVVSLLRLQLRHKHYANLEAAINDSLRRILAIAAVHDLLSREDLDHVGIKSIAEALVTHQQQSFIAPDKTIRFKVRGDDVRLNMTQATQVALVLNELISNAVEHGFEKTSEGDVHVTVEVGDDDVGVWVSNSGDKLQPGFDPQVHSHLGLQIVANLARSLGGHFVIEDRLGWTVTEVVFARASSE